MNILPDQYSEALLSLDSTSEQREHREATLEALSMLLRGDEAFRSFVLHPEVTEEKKLMFLQAHVDEVSARLLVRLVRNHDTNKLDVILDAYKKHRDEAEGYERVLVTSAFPLSAASRNELREKMEDLLKKKIRLRERIDKHLLGGCVISFSDNRIDISIRAKMDELRKQFSFEVR